MINVEETIISQYGNSATITQLIRNMNTYIDPRADFDNFYDYVWNIDTAQGFGLDIWGRIVDVERQVNVPAGIPDQSMTKNLLLYSNQFNQISWVTSAATISPDVAASFDGSLSADKLTPSTANTTHDISQYILSTYGHTYSASINVKNAGYNFAYLSFTGASTGGTNPFIEVNLTTGAILQKSASLTAAVVSKANGWFELQITYTTVASGVLNLSTKVGSSAGVSSFAGNGSSGIYLCNAQIEFNNHVTDYVSSDLSFVSRASSGTYFGSNGFLQTATDNVARMQYNPLNLSAPPTLLLEKQSSNLIPYSENNAVWIKINVSTSTDTQISPNGITLANKVYENTVNSQHVIVQNSSTIIAGQNITASCYFKKSGRDIGWLQINNNAYTNGFRAVFNLTSETVSSQAFGSGLGLAVSIQNIGSGWYKVNATGIIDSVSTSAVLVIVLNNGLVYAGDGVSGFYVWGAQLEQGSIATSYIPTTASIASRSADISTSSRTTYTPGVVTLTDDEYRTVLLVKALANITNGTAQGLNQLLQNLFASRGRCYVRDTGSMTMAFTFEFFLKPFEYVILMAAGVAPRPAGVLSNIFQVDVPNTFGFAESIHLQPFDQGTFYVSL